MGWIGLAVAVFYFGWKLTDDFLENTKQGPPHSGYMSHLNRDKIASNLSVLGIQGSRKNILYDWECFEIYPPMICLYAR